MKVKVWLDPLEREALWMGLEVGMSSSVSPDLTAAERGTVFYGVMRDIHEGFHSSGPLKLAVPGRQAKIIGRTLAAALQSNDERLDDTHRTLIPHLLTLFPS